MPQMAFGDIRHELVFFLIYLQYLYEYTLF
jgi:hypothetical protein